MLLATFLAVPAALLGTWTSSCGSEFPARLHVKATEIVMGRARTATACRVTGQRQLSTSRWYLDLTCDDGSIAQLDLFLVGADNLLLAQRPLGEACPYQRSP
jgi:hypothetical protein